MRIGFGYDAHRLVKGRKCIICGVEIQSDFGPDGHSDADVPIHALIDAMLGALALGDIGKWFPDNDDKYYNVSSIELLKKVYTAVKEKNYCIGNIDITIVLQSPRLFSYIEQMRLTVSEAIKVNIDKISIKATTEEKMGFTGDGTGISATAVVLLNKSV